MSAAPPVTTDLKSTLEELRASVAAQGTRTGLKGTIQEALLGLFSVLLKMLEDFRAGRLAPLAEVAEAVGGGADRATASPSPERSPVEGEGGVRGGLGVWSRISRAAGWWADLGEMEAEAYPSASGSEPRFCRQTGEPVAGSSRSVGSRCAMRDGGPIEGSGTTEGVASAGVSAEAADVRAEALPLRPIARCAVGPDRGERDHGALRVAFAGRRSARGVRWALAPGDGRWRLPAGGHFFKNATLERGVGAAMSFQYQNDSAAARE